jgi:hypothetical protein
MQKDSLLDKHMQEIEAEISLAQSINPIESPAPPPSIPAPGSSQGGSYDPQTEMQINKNRQQRYDEYLQIIENIKNKYQDHQIVHLFETAYAQFSIYLDAYLQLIEFENPAQFKEDVGIFIDFGEKAKICRYPLARKYIITIPQEDAVANPPIWTSMAHELGHFVYWNSGFYNRELAETADGGEHILFSEKIVDLAGLKSLEELKCAIDSENNLLPPITKQQVLAAMLIGWSEEIFADTFGAIVGGIVFAEQAKSALLNDLADLNKKRFETDRDHPYSLLRPFISATALEKYRNEKNSLWRSLKSKIAANSILKENLRSSLNNMSDPPGGITDISDENLKIEIKAGEQSIVLSLDEIKTALSELIQIFVEKIPKSRPLPRGTNAWDFIEKFDNPQPNLVYRVIEGIGYWIKAVWS